MEIKGQPEREMIHLEGFIETIQYLDQNNPEALKEMQQELQSVIDRYKERYRVIETIPYSEGMILYEKIKERYSGLFQKLAEN